MRTISRPSVGFEPRPKGSRPHDRELHVSLKSAAIVLAPSGTSARPRASGHSPHVPGFGSSNGPAEQSTALPTRETRLGATPQSGTRLSGRGAMEAPDRAIRGLEAVDATSFAATDVGRPRSSRSGRPPRSLARWRSGPLVRRGEVAGVGGEPVDQPRVASVMADRAFEASFPLEPVL